MLARSRMSFGPIIGILLPFILAAGPGDKVHSPSNTPATTQAVKTGPKPAATKETAGVAPREELFDEAASDAHSICYVFDISAAHEPRTCAKLRLELIVTLGRLKPSQQFNVIFCQEGHCVAVAPDELLSATPENRGKAMAFLYDVGTSAKTDPMPGLELAMKQTPDVIYFVTDHALADGAAVAGKIRELNKEAKAKINTIAMVTEAHPDPAWGQALLQIAKENRGTSARSFFDDSDALPSSTATVPPAPAAHDGDAHVLFWDTENETRIAFVCDASGSMINKMPTLKEQLIKTINGFKPTQSFEMIFFQDNKFDSFVRYARWKTLIPAADDAKRAAARFLEGVTTTGSTDPIPGITAAFMLNPSVIYLLTDGDFPDNDALLKTVRELNKRKNVKINTIAFVGEGDNEVAFLTLLETIARESHGKFKHAKEKDY